MSNMRHATTDGAQRGAYALRAYYGHDEGELLPLLTDLAELALDLGVNPIETLAVYAGQTAATRRSSSRPRAPKGSS
jgi:hypothetical protein